MMKMKSNVQRYFAIGDIHGEYSKLISLIKVLEEKVNFKLGEDILVQLGDMVDRGSDSYKVVEYFRFNKELFPDHVIVTRGNHEDMLLDLAHHRSDLALFNGANSTIKSYSQESQLYGKNNLYKSLIKTQHFDFLNNLPYFYETEDYFFNHSPIPLEKYREHGIIGLDFRQNKHELTWGYVDEVSMWDTKLVLKTYGNDYKLQVVGHIHHGVWNKEKRIIETVNPIQIDNLIFIDSGCGCWKEAVLSCVELPSLNVYQSDGNTFNFGDK